MNAKPLGLLLIALSLIAATYTTTRSTATTSHLIFSGKVFNDTTDAMSMWGFVRGDKDFPAYFRVAGVESLIVFPSMSDNKEDWVSIPSLVVRRGEILKTRLLSREWLRLVFLKSHAEPCTLRVSFETTVENPKRD